MSTKFASAFLMLIVASGCWHEVEYTPPAPGSGAESKVAAAPPSEPAAAPIQEAASEKTDAAGGGFGDDLAASLSTEKPAESSTSTSPSTPGNEVAATSPSVVGDRYAATAPTPIAPTEPETSKPPQETTTAKPADTTPTAGGVDPLFGELSAPTTMDSKPATATASEKLPDTPPTVTEPTTTPSTDTSADLFASPATSEAAAPAATTVTEPTTTISSTTTTNTTPTSSTAAPTAADDTASLFAESDAKNDANVTTTPIPENTNEMTAEQREAIAETSPVPLAAPPDDGGALRPAMPQKNTRRAAWLLGSKLSLAVLGDDHGASAEQVKKLFGQSQQLAQVLNIKLPQPPPRPTTPIDNSSNDPSLKYLFTQGQGIGRDLTQRMGADHAALFEVAVKSNILLVLYQPGTPAADAIASAIRQAGTRAKLPPTLLQPLLEAINARAPIANVQKTVFKLHADADKLLATPPTP